VNPVKRILYFYFIVAGLLLCQAKGIGQINDTSSGKTAPLDAEAIISLLQGKWVYTDDSLSTMQIINDSIYDYSSLAGASCIYIYTITRDNCSKNRLKGSSTGFYLSEKCLSDNSEYCGAIETINAKRVKIVFGKQDIISIKRKR
jgi:hypothetical protein